MSAPEVAPLAAPDPATTDWVPIGPSGGSIPQPVVNGQWVKGVGGAAVWSAIAAADVPGIKSVTGPNAMGMSWGPQLDFWVDGATKVASLPRIAWYGPYQVQGASTPATADPSNGAGTVAYAHGFGVTPTIVLYEVEDGSWSHMLITRLVRDATNVTFFYANTSSVVAAFPLYRFVIGLAS
jgi:hypothetical protein